MYSSSGIFMVLFSFLHAFGGVLHRHTKTHPQTHALYPIIVDLFFFLFPSRTSCGKHCKKQTHHNPRQRRPKKIKYIFRKIISFYLFTFLKNKK